MNSELLNELNKKEEEKEKLKNFINVLIKVLNNLYDSKNKGNINETLENEINSIECQISELNQELNDIEIEILKMKNVIINS